MSTWKPRTLHAKIKAIKFRNEEPKKLDPSPSHSSSGRVGFSVAVTNIGGQAKIMIKLHTPIDPSSRFIHSESNAPFPLPGGNIDFNFQTEGTKQVTGKSPWYRAALIEQESGDVARLTCIERRGFLYGEGLA